jgi:hypothetical protein
VRYSETVKNFPCIAKEISTGRGDLPKRLGRRVTKNAYVKRREGKTEPAFPSGLELFFISGT